ncbi:DUF2510 domain-containing protein [Tsukamurella sp. 8F]|uniref:DUF2510 domain-containing protein n=1 Tax=unclassified Tsukamurella TaxID=2633480 RepID=UPI0023B8DB77|nr:MULTISPECIES: DUF2510 domain-containing protein [unclassified Tsukamurella]MDF0529974.1 DUF2510 domain-containing protein [Tsukamurella sp. 8J]MDF0587254.1 DUF2510 domain-containing protein [Tsukamurella sp. 8F]
MKRLRTSKQVGLVRVTVAPTIRSGAQRRRSGDDEGGRIAAAVAPTAKAARVAGARLKGTTLSAPTSAPPPIAPAGWYPDPDNDAAVRWWNGRKWTRRTAPRV